MKKLLLIFAISIFLFSGQNVFAYTESDIWQIKNYVVEVRPAADSHELDINEEITVYFDPTVIEENNLDINVRVALQSQPLEFIEL